MKQNLSLIIAAICMAFLAGYFAISWRGDYQASASDLVKIAQTKNRFRESVTPRSILNFSAIYYSRYHFQLLNPLSSFEKDKVEADKKKYSTNTECFASLATLINSLKEKKVLIWEEYRCGFIKRLPRNYFSEAPFLHPSGLSYVYLAFLSGREVYKHENWIRQNYPFFHVLELSDLNKFLKRPLEGVFGVLQDFQDNSLLDLVKGSEFVITKNFFLSRVRFRFDPSLLEYRLYYRTDFEKYLKNGPFQISNHQTGRDCFFQDGSICWQYNVGYLLKNSDKANILFSIGSLIFIFLIVGTLWNKLKSQKFEDERKRFALRVLTHEFRTPVASMLLQMDGIQKSINEIPENLQESFLRLSNDVYRLQRLTEASRNYLQAQKNKKLVQIKKVSIPSVNEFITNQLDKYLDQCQLNLLDKDQGISLDPYWVGICLKNILENALFHGEKPIIVTLSFDKRQNGSGKVKYLAIEVKDSGKCEFSDLKTITSEFVKGEKSEGTGLGLNIVHKSLLDMGGFLDFKLSPTRFTLKIPISNKDKEL